VDGGEGSVRPRQLGGWTSSCQRAVAIVIPFANISVRLQLRLKSGAVTSVAPPFLAPTALFRN
jgi:hypothetical protein